MHLCLHTCALLPAWPPSPAVLGTEWHMCSRVLLPLMTNEKHWNADLSHLKKKGRYKNQKDYKTSLESHSYKPCSSSRLSSCSWPPPLCLTQDQGTTSVSSSAHVKLWLICVHCCLPLLSVPWVQSLSSTWAAPASSFKGTVTHT